MESHPYIHYPHTSLFVCPHISCRIMVRNLLNHLSGLLIPVSHWVDLDPSSSRRAWARTDYRNPHISTDPRPAESPPLLLSVLNPPRTCLGSLLPCQTPEFVFNKCALPLPHIASLVPMVPGLGPHFRKYFHPLTWLVHPGPS